MENQNPVRVLALLLMSLFDLEELRLRLSEFQAYGANIRDEINFGASLSQVCSAVAERMFREEEPPAKLLSYLYYEKPGRRDDIVSAARKMDIALGSMRRTSRDQGSDPLALKLFAEVEKGVVNSAPSYYRSYDSPEDMLSLSVPLHLVAEGDRSILGQNGRLGTQPAHSPFPADRLVAVPWGRFIIFGEAGAGKTWTVCGLAHDLAEELIEEVDAGSQSGRALDLRGLLRIPIYLKMAYVSAERGLSGAIEIAYGAEFVDAVMHEVEAGRAVVFLDAYDEASDKGGAARALARVSAEVGEGCVIVTCRPGPRRPVADGFSDVDLCAPSPEQQEELLEQWPLGRDARLLREIRSRPRLAAIATKPLYLTLIAMFGGDAFGPKNTLVHIYEQAVEFHLSRLHKLDDASPRMPGPTYSRRALAHVAWSLVEHDGMAVARDRLVDILDAPQSGWDRVKELTPHWRSPEAWLDDFSAHSGLISRSRFPLKGKPAYEFSHMSFREYLAAVHVAEGLEGVELPRLGREVIEGGLSQSAPELPEEALPPLLASVLGGVARDLGRWRPILFWMTSLLEADQADGLVRWIAATGRESLALAALAHASGVGAETVLTLLERPWRPEIRMERHQVLVDLVEILGSEAEALGVVSQLLPRTTHAQELWCLDQVLERLQRASP